MSDVKIIVIAVIVFGSLLGAFLMGGNFFNSLSCARAWEDSGIDSRYSFIGGCQIKVDGLWIPSSAYRDLGDGS